MRIVTLPGLGSLALDGSAVSVNDAVPAADLGDLVFTPVADGNGDPYTEFTFKVSDGVAESNAAYTMTINVTAVADDPEVTISAGTSPVTEGTAATFTLSRTATGTALTATVSVTETGDMISGAAPTQVVFGASATTATLTVATENDAADEPHSRVTATVSTGTGYTVGTANSATVTVRDDEAATDITLPAGTIPVPLDWRLAPSGLVVDDSFRLLVVSSGVYPATNTNIAHYDTVIRNNVRETGFAAIRSYASGFRMLGCTSSTDADDHTSTTHTVAAPGLPIYWLSGSKVADDYGDFYDGAWDSNSPKAPNGANAVFYDAHTGCLSNGTKQPSASHRLGGSRVRLGTPTMNGSEMDKGSGTIAGNGRHYYGLSQVFRLTDVPLVSTVAIASTAPGNDSDYETGDEIRATVTFNEAVTVDIGGGTPQLQLTIGEQTRNAGYSASHSSATELAFTYTVVAEDRDNDGVSIAANALSLNSGAIYREGATSVPALLVFPSLSAQEPHKVNLPPGVVSVAVTSTPRAAENTYGAGEQIKFTVTFSNAVEVSTGRPHFEFSTGAPRQQAGGVREWLGHHGAGVQLRGTSRRHGRQRHLDRGRDQNHQTRQR